MAIDSYAVLLAAGIGKRTGLSIPKQMLKIKNREIILHSLDIFIRSKINFRAVIITVPPAEAFNFNWDGFFGERIPLTSLKKIRVITGGAERQESVLKSIQFLDGLIPETKKDGSVIFIHDSARPFVLEGEIESLLRSVSVSGASFLCSNVSETVKEIYTPEHDLKLLSTAKIAEKFKTLDRRRLVSAKTPQVFKYPIIKKALEKAAEEGFYSTDDVSLVENINVKAFPLISSDYNIKITTFVDLEIARCLFTHFKKVDKKK